MTQKEKEVIVKLFRETLSNPKKLGKLIKAFKQFVEKYGTPEFEEVLVELRREANKAKDPEQAKKLLRIVARLPRTLIQAYRGRIRNLDRYLGKIDKFITKLFEKTDELADNLQSLSKSVSKPKRKFDSSSFLMYSWITMTGLLGLIRLYRTADIREIFKKMVEDAKKLNSRFFIALVMVALILVGGYGMLKELRKMF
jgi:hypothetical protein